MAAECQSWRAERPSPDLSQGLMAAAGGRGWRVWAWSFVSGYEGGRAVGPGGRGLHGPLGFLPCSAGRVYRWSGRVRDGLDALPGGDDFLRPGPVLGDLQGSASAAAGEAGGGVQDAVAQRL